MAYTYLLDMYKEIDQRINDAEREIEAGNLSAEQVRFQKGRQDLLVEFKSFLSANLDAQLPKRIRKRLSSRTI